MQPAPIGSAAPPATPPTLPGMAPPARPAAPIDTLLLCAARIATFDLNVSLTNASGFYFQRDDRLYLVTSRHVVHDEPSGHRPNRIQIEMHTDATDLTQAASVPLMLYGDDGRSLWRQGQDSAGEIDVAVLPLDPAVLPEGAIFQAFTPAHLHVPPARAEVGTPLLIVGFPLGFQDTVYQLPVVRQSIVASAFGIRFQGKGYFLTDARMHRGASGAPVVMRQAGDAALPWKLLGVHSARMDMANRDLVQDESLGLNCAWYADILMTLTED